MIWPQITYLILFAMSVGMHLAKNGEPRGNYSFWGCVFTAGLSFWILWEGGFWRPLFGG